MTDLIVFFEKLYALRVCAFSRRFLPFTAALLVGIIIITIWSIITVNAPGIALIALLATILLAFATWASAVLILPHENKWLKRTERLINECSFEEAEHTLKAPPRFIGFATRMRRLEMIVRLKIETGKLTEAYAILANAERGALLPEERISVRLRKANVLFHAGNHASFRKELGALDSMVPDSGPQRFCYSLLKSHQHELEGNYASAKMLLEDAMELEPLPKYVAVALNNLARLEDAQGNDTNAQSYYERGWQILRANPLPLLYPIVAHNLLLKYARKGNAEKALKLLDEYRSAISTGNTEQYLQYLNDQLHLARQLGNRPLLLDDYERAERDLKPRLDKRQRLALTVSGLRMRLNDGIGFAEHLNEALNLFDEYQDLPPSDRFQILSELVTVIEQGRSELNGWDFREPAQRTIAALVAMEEEVAAQLRNIPPALPSVRDTWYGHKLRLHKLKIQLAAPRVSHSAVEEMFRLLCERRQVWADKGNPEGEIKALIVLCDEYVAYARQLNRQFAEDYRSIAEQALADAGKILESQWPHPAMHQYALGIAYFYWQIANDRESAALWVYRFESLKLNVTHYAKWLREYYKGVKKWLSELN